MTDPAGLRAQLDRLTALIRDRNAVPDNQRTFAQELELRNLEQHHQRLAEGLRAEEAETIEISFDGGDRVTHSGIDSGLFAKVLYELRASLAAGALTAEGEQPTRLIAEGYRRASPQLASSQPGSFTAVLVGPRHAEFSEVGRSPFAKAAYEVVSALAVGGGPPEDFLEAVAPLGGRSARALGQMLGYIGRAKAETTLTWHAGAIDQVTANVSPHRAKALSGILKASESEEEEVIEVGGLLGEASVFANHFDIRNADTGEVYKGGVPNDQVEALRQHFGRQCRVRLVVRVATFPGGLETRTYTLQGFLE